MNNATPARAFTHADHSLGHLVNALRCISVPERRKADRKQSAEIFADLMARAAR